MMSWCPTLVLWKDVDRLPNFMERNGPVAVLVEEGNRIRLTFYDGYMLAYIFCVLCHICLICQSAGTYGVRICLN